MEMAVRSQEHAAWSSSSSGGNFLLGRSLQDGLQVTNFGGNELQTALSKA